MTEREAAAASARPDLHAAIMNLPCKVNNERPVPSSNEQGWRDGYVMGHRDARHAAAELALADRAASAPQAVRMLSDDEIDEVFEQPREYNAFVYQARDLLRKFCEVNGLGIVPLAPQEENK